MHAPSSIKGQLEILKQQVKRMHNKNYVHGDLLPRNVILNGDNGCLIDFDLSREQNGLCYVAAYNSSDGFLDYRHFH